MTHFLKSIVKAQGTLSEPVGPPPLLPVAGSGGGLSSAAAGGGGRPPRPSIPAAVEGDPQVTTTTVMATAQVAGVWRTGEGKTRKRRRRDVTNVNPLLLHLPLLTQTLTALCPQSLRQHRAPRMNHPEGKKEEADRMRLNGLRPKRLRKLPCPISRQLLNFPSGRCNCFTTSLRPQVARRTKLSRGGC